MLSFAEVFPTGTLHFKIEPAVMMDEVVGFMLAMMMGTGVAFELPVILAVMGWLGLVTRRGSGGSTSTPSSWRSSSAAC